MPYSYSEHISDIGIRAAGSGLESAFEAGAEAMLNIMFELDTINEVRAVEIKANAKDIELLFVEVLNEILSIQGRDSLAFKRLHAAEIKRVDGGYLFAGTAHGELLDLKRHGVKTEVKGATYSGLRYIRSAAGEHILECVLDV